MQQKAHAPNEVLVSFVLSITLQHFSLDIKAPNKFISNIMNRRIIFCLLPLFYCVRFPQCSTHISIVSLSFPNKNASVAHHLPRSGDPSYLCALHRGSLITLIRIICGRKWFVGMVGGALQETFPRDYSCIRHIRIYSVIISEINRSNMRPLPWPPIEANVPGVPSWHAPIFCSRLPTQFEHRFRSHGVSRMKHS